MKFINPTNGYAEDRSLPFLWALFFGPLYFVAVGAWGHALLYFIIVLVLSPTILLPIFVWIFYTVCAPGIVRRTYLRKGWEENDE